MAWGQIEAEPEVSEWLLALDDEDFGQVERYIDLLADQGVHLGEHRARRAMQRCIDEKHINEKQINKEDP